MKYFYLISSLPSLALDMDHKKLDFKEIFSLIERNLEPEDRKIYEALILQNDNRNLLNILFQDYHQLAFENVHLPSYLKFDTLKDYKRRLGELPDYMINFIQDNAGVFATYSLSQLELRLRKHFVEYIQQFNSIFLLKYYEFKFQLEKVIAEVNQAYYDFLSDPNAYEIDYLRSTSIVFDQIDEKKIIAEISPLVESGNYLALERKVDSYYGQFSERWTEVFTINTVLAYVIKLLRIARWSVLSTHAHEYENEFMDLLDRLKSESRTLKMPTI